MCGGLGSGNAQHHEAPLPSILAEINNMHNQGVETLSISGGEPTIYHGFVDLMNHVGCMDFKHVSLFTNGRLLTERVVEQIIGAGVDCIVVSLHAPDEILGDQIANVKGAFRQTIKGLEILTRLKAGQLFRVMISCVPCKLTESILQDIASLALNYAIDEFLITFSIDARGDAPIPRNKLPSLGALSKSVPLALDLLAEKEVSILVSLIPPCLYPGYEYCYFEAKHAPDRIMVGFHQKGGRVEKIPYYDLKPTDICTKVPDCAGCLYDTVCFGVPNLYIEKYQAGEVTAATIDKVVRTFFQTRLQYADIPH